ncbi:MAG: cyclic nucleotide-binding protein, partial [Caldimonas sp.]
MLPAFSFASAPFDGLTQAERELLLDSVEPARFAKDTVLLTPGAAVDHAWLLVEGHVQLVEAGEVVALDGPGD